MANFHREYDGMSVEVVDVDKVYNEFSSGAKNATGIRNFIKKCYDTGNSLKYVLLFGDGSFDNRNILPDSKNFIPTFQSDNSLVPTSSFVTDDYFVMLDAGESVYNGAIDLGIGRIPSSTVYEAEIVVNKVHRYYAPESLGDWRNTLCFIGDDGDNGLHMRQSEELADIVNKNNKEFITDKIFFDAFVEEVTSAGERYPDVNAAINERVKDGVLVLNYVGHANDRFLAHEHVLDVSDINSWSNSDILPIFVTATCEFSRFDSNETSAGEYVLFNPSGGGIGLFSTTRVVYAGPNFALSKSFYNYIFGKDEQGEHYRMGEVMRLAKINTGTSRSTNKRNFSLLADPALKLSYPKYKVVTTNINQQDATVNPDTVGALDKITVTGFISDYLDNKLNNFNGEIIPTVFDKEVLMETLGNGGQKSVSFKMRENIIYKGRTTVTNGNFTFSFVIPKDISYSLGKGKIVYYASDGKDDAHGAFENFFIGGSGSEIVDNKGPDIRLFMDSQDFLNGDETSKNP
ncbi:MAG: type IX secretion system sortase PorU, partial [Draconibacterium sp.]|nr:type IX secretion system sortase PorU [Draconibacterium sp.]